jgi:hypothetical protein
MLVVIIICCSSLGYNNIYSESRNECEKGKKEKMMIWL